MLLGRRGGQGEKNSHTTPYHGLVPWLVSRSCMMLHARTESLPMRRLITLLGSGVDRMRFLGGEVRTIHLENPPSTLRQFATGHSRRLWLTCQEYKNRHAPLSLGRGSLSFVLTCPVNPNLIWVRSQLNQSIVPKILTVDTSASTTMKNAAKRDIYCELQNSVNHQNFERSLRPRVTPSVVPH
jgi:hypothetical protein